FADAGYHDAAAAAEQQRDGLHEVAVELVAQRAHGVRLDVEHVAGERERPVIIDFRYHARSIAKAFVRRAAPSDSSEVVCPPPPPAPALPWPRRTRTLCP